MFFLPLVSYLFILFYFMFLLILFFLEDLLMFWIVLEFSAFMFSGICFLEYGMNFSGFMLYYIVQSYSSLMLLTSSFLLYLMPYFSFLLFEVFIFMKIALFPFSSWYYISLKSIPLFSFILMLFPQKFPLLLFNNLYLLQCFYQELTFFIMLSVLSVFFCCLSIPSVLSFRYMMIWSSIMTGSWLYLSSICLSGVLVIFYFVIYSLLSLMFIYYFMSKNNGISVLLLMMMLGVPPSPLFFSKFLVLIGLMESFITYGGILLSLVLLMLFSSIFIILYLRMFSYLTLSSSSFKLSL